MLTTPWLLLMIATADQPPAAIDRLGRRQVAAWCSAAEGTPDAVRCLDYVYAVANRIDRSRLSMRMPQCVPATANGEDLRALAARALTAKRPGNVDAPDVIVASAIVDAFHCTSDRREGSEPVPVTASD